MNKEIENLNLKYAPKKTIERKNFYLNQLPITAIDNFKSLAKKKKLSHTKLFSYLLEYYEINNK